MELNKTKEAVKTLNKVLKLNLDYYAEIVITLIDNEDHYKCIGSFIGADDKILIGEIELFKYHVLKRNTTSEKLDDNIYLLLLNSILDRNMFKRENLTIKTIE